MLGVGPEWVHVRQNGKVTNSISGEIAGDFMFWPTGKHRFGWFLEPAYDYSFAGGHQQSIGWLARNPSSSSLACFAGLSSRWMSGAAGNRERI